MSTDPKVAELWESDADYGNLTLPFVWFNSDRIVVSETHSVEWLLSVQGSCRREVLKVECLLRHQVVAS